MMKKGAVALAVAGALALSAPAFAASPTLSGEAQFILTTPINDTKLDDTVPVWPYPASRTTWTYKLNATVDSIWKIDVRFSPSTNVLSGAMSGYRIDLAEKNFNLIAAYNRNSADGTGSDNTVAPLGDWVGIRNIPAPPAATAPYQTPKILRATTKQWDTDFVIQGVADSTEDGLYVRGTKKIGPYELAVTVRDHMNAGDDKYTLGTYAVVPAGKFTLYPGFGFNTATGDTENSRIHVYANGTPVENFAVESWFMLQDKNWGNTTYYDAKGTYVLNNAVRLQGITKHTTNRANDTSVKNDNYLEGSVVWRANDSVHFDYTFALSGVYGENYVTTTAPGVKVRYFTQKDSAKVADDTDTRFETFVTSPIVPGKAWSRATFIRVTDLLYGLADSSAYHGNLSTREKTYTLVQGYVKVNDKTVWRPSVTHVTLGNGAKVITNPTTGAYVLNDTYKFARTSVSNSVAYTLSARTSLNGGVTFTSVDNNGAQSKINEVSAGLTYKTSDNAVLSLTAGRNQTDNAAPTGNLTATITLKF